MRLSEWLTHSERNTEMNTYYYAENAVFETLEQAQSWVASQPLAKIWEVTGYASFETLETEFEAEGSNGITTTRTVAR
jgi:hypothetical protein